MTKNEVIKTIDNIEFDTDAVKEIAAKTIADYVLNYKDRWQYHYFKSDVIEAVTLAVQNTAETMKGIIKMAISEMPEKKETVLFNRSFKNSGVNYKVVMNNGDINDITIKHFN